MLDAIFFKGVKSLGIKRAHGLVEKERTLSRLMHSIRADSGYEVNRNFMTDIYRACLVFRHQSVFDMDSGKAVHLSPFDPAQIAMLPRGVVPTGPDGEPDLSFLGTNHSEQIIRGIAIGEVNPFSLERYAVALDDTQNAVLTPSVGQKESRRPEAIVPASKRSKQYVPHRSIQAFKNRFASEKKICSVQNASSGEHTTRTEFAVFARSLARNVLWSVERHRDPGEPRFNVRIVPLLQAFENAAVYYACALRELL